MKLTLAFDIYNKERWIESSLDSWISNLSGQNEYEIIIVFDDCKDRSEEIARRYLSRFNYPCKFLHADNRYELYCNNLALQHATGDYIVFIQDDNWIYDKNWDAILEEVLERTPNVGAIGFLAGIRLLPNPRKIELKRIEIDRPHKGQNFTGHNLPVYQMGAWQVDAINRPFCISRKLLLSYGGLDTAFSPACGDDLDLSIKLLKDGKVNMYIPFDLLNIVSSKDTLQADFIRKLYGHAYSLNYERYGKFLAQRRNDSVTLLIPLRIAEDGWLISEESSRIDFPKAGKEKKQENGIEAAGSIAKVKSLMTTKFLDRNQYAIWFSDRCNYKCSYCCNRGDPRAPYSLVEKRPQQVIDLFNKAEPGVILLSGGEPTLWENFREIIEGLPQHFWALCTNLSIVPDWVYHPNIKIVIPAYHDEFASKERFTDNLVRLKEMDKRIHVKLLVKPGIEYDNIDLWEKWNGMSIPTSLVPLSETNYKKQFILDVVEKYRTSCMYNARFFQIPGLKDRRCNAGTRNAFQLNLDGMLQRCAMITDKLGSMFSPEFDGGKQCNHSCLCEWHHWGCMALANDNETWNAYVRNGVWEKPAVEELKRFIMDMQWDLCGKTIERPKTPLFHSVLSPQKGLENNKAAHENQCVEDQQINKQERQAVTLAMPESFKGPVGVQAYLLDDFKIEIDKRCAEIGGCWEGAPRNGLPAAGSVDELRFFYERIRQYNQPVIIDIGANTGSFSLLAAMNPQMKSYAFEPMPLTYELFCNNISLNGLQDRIKSYQVALADRNGIAVLKYPKSDKASGLAFLGSPLRFKEWTEHRVECRRLDDFAAENGIGRADVIKIDTEGCELFVLKGAEKYIRRYNPDIFCEYYEPNTRQFGYDPVEIVKLLTSWGYHCEHVGTDNIYCYLPQAQHCHSEAAGSATLSDGNGYLRTSQIKTGQIGMAPLKQETERPKSDSKGPYLSVVVTSRNDGYNDNILHRMQVFVTGLVEQCKRFNLDAELIVVEWSPPADKKRLYEALEWPDDLGPLTVRFIEVPVEIHNSIGNSNKIPFFQMIAKNVGIRRAKGEFVLATNMDLLFSNELMQFLATRQLDENCFYRVERYDVGCKTIPTNIGLDEQLKFCRDNVVRVGTIDGTKTISEFEIYRAGCTDEQTKPHTNGCGDFTLLARGKWYSLRGYPELPLWSIHIDGVFVYMAYASGLRQVILQDPMRIYHIEHDTTWGCYDAVQRKRMGEIYPCLDSRKDYKPWCARMKEEKRPITTNDKNWGYPAERFKEHILNEQQREKNIDKQPGERNVDEQTKEKSMDEQRRERDISVQVAMQSDYYQTFPQWIDKLALVQNRLYYKDQTPQSLKMLVDLVHSYNPTKIIELGTAWGLSLRAWLTAKSEAEIIAVDLSFNSLSKSQEVLSADFSKVKFLEQNILKTDFSRLWSDKDRVILYINAHDAADAPIMRHILDNVLPILPPDSVIVVDDLWYDQAVITKDSVCKLLDEITLHKGDCLLCFEGCYAPYWKGGFFIGFQELMPLMEWINHNQIELIFKPDDKAVAFKRPKIFGNTDKSFDKEKFRRMSGRVEYNPVKGFSVPLSGDTARDRQAFTLCETAAQLYAEGRIKESEAGFKKALDTNPGICGAYYAQAVCSAREGNFEEAQKLLQLEANSSCPHPNVQTLYRDICRVIRSRNTKPSEVQHVGGIDNITIFAMPKAFQGRAAVIQKNAIKSWTLLQPRPEIILFGNDDGVAEAAKEFGLRHIPDVKRNKYGTPLVSYLFEKAQAVALNNILVYINSDIVLMSDFLPAVRRVTADFDKFLMIGRRWDLDVKEPLDFGDKNWEDKLRSRVTAAGSLHMDRGIDYFVFTQGLWPYMPAFGIGRSAWDNWLVGEPIAGGKRVVDATEAVTVVHQNHESIINSDRREEEMVANKELAGMKIVMGFGAVSDAPWKLTKTHLVRKKHEGYIEQVNDFCARLIKKGWEEKYLLYKEYFHSVTYRQKAASPDISIVVISWKLHPDTIKNFQSLYSQRDANFELIFVNNGAEDGEFDSLKLFIDTHIRLNANTGAYLARNIGAVFARAPVILFLDDDGIPDKGMLRAYLKAFEKYDAIVVHGSTWPKSKSAEIGIGYYFGPRPFPCISHQEGNSAYAAREFYKAGGWDDQIIRGGGGIDLARRLIEVEPDMRKQIYFPDAVLYHDFMKDGEMGRRKKMERRNSGERIREKLPDYPIFEVYYDRYSQREDLLILKNTARRSDASANSEHIYPSKIMVDYAIQLKKKSADFLATAIACLRDGNMDDVMKYLGFASINRRLPNLHFTTAVAYVRFNQLCEAREECELELRLQPEHKGAKDLLRQIEKYEQAKAAQDERKKAVFEAKNTVPVAGAEPGGNFGGDNNPLASVIMPAYNASKHIAKAIKSVLTQSSGNFELIIVDDGSTDDTKNVISGFKDVRIKYFYNEHKGPSAARNLAINRAAGQYIIPLDSDDMMTPDFIIRHLQEFEKHPEADLVYCDDCFIDESDRHIRVVSQPEYSDRKSLVRDLFRCGFSIVPFRTCIKKAVFDKIGLYDEALLVAEDYDMMRRFVKNGLKVHHLPEALYLRRMTSDCLSRNYSAQKAGCYFDVVRRFIETFNYDELFPDIDWDGIAPQIRPLHAKCMAAVTCLAIGRTFAQADVPVYAATAFDLACTNLDDCLKTDPQNQQIRQLLQKCRSARSKCSETAQQNAAHAT